MRGSTSSTNQVQDKCQAMERPGSEMKMVVDSLKCQQVFIVKGAHADVPKGTWAQPQSTVDRKNFAGCSQPAYFHLFLCSGMEVRVFYDHHISPFLRCIIRQSIMAEYHY